MPRNRVLALVLVAAVVAAPAVVLRALCVGRACDEPSGAASEVPFCSLPPDLRQRVARGFREGPSPDVAAVAGDTAVVGGSAFEGRGPHPAWPSSAAATQARVPLVFAGAGVAPGALPEGVTLDRVAPTIAAVVGLRRPHPEVRSGEAIPGVAAGGERPRLVLEVVLEGVGRADLEHDARAWRNLRSLLEDGAGTLDADVGALPLDPAAVLTTIGTGGTPSQHGVTGTLVRDERGAVVRAWSRRFPISVIATLGDDLDERLAQEPVIGLAAGEASHRGLIGGAWYVEVDRDRVVVGPDPMGAARSMLRAGFGRDRVPDLLAVAARGPLDALDRGLGRLVAAARAAASGSVLVVVTATGEGVPAGAGVGYRTVVDAVEAALGAGDDVVAAAAPGGLYLDQDVVAARGIPEDEVLRALAGVEGPSGRPLFVDAFPAIAVSFARYC